MLAEKLISFVSLQINLGQSDFDKLVGYMHGTRHKPEGGGVWNGRGDNCP